MIDKTIKKVAVIIDGGHVRKLLEKHRIRITADKVLSLGEKILSEKEELFRTYYYDSPPFGGKLFGPISNAPYRSLTTNLEDLRMLYSTIGHHNSVAFRHGNLRFNGWTLRKTVFDNLVEGRGLPSSLNDSHFKPVFKQKGVDMKIGLDIAWLAIKKIVHRIVLVSGDSDFVPAMKLARVEGVQVVLVPLNHNIHADMREHSDEVRNIDLRTI